jgi:hypothetical protein
MILQLDLLEIVALLEIDSQVASSMQTSACCLFLRGWLLCLSFSSRGGGSTVR